MNLFRTERLLKSTLVVAVGSVATRAMAVLSNIAFARMLGPRELGLVSLAAIVHAVSIPFFLGGRGMALVRHGSTHQGGFHYLMERYYRRPLLFAAAGSATCALLAKPVAEMLLGSASHANVIRITALTLFLFTVYTLLCYTFQGQRMFWAHQTLHTLQAAGYLGAGFLLALLHPRAVSVLWGLTFSYAASVAALLWAWRRSWTPAPDTGSPAAESAGKDLASFTRWVFCAEVCYGVISSGLYDRWVISRFASMEATGLYYASLGVGLVLFTAVRVAGEVLAPRISQLVLAGNVAQAADYTRSVMLVAALGYVVAASAVLSVRHRFVLLLFGAAYRDSAQLLGVCLCACAYHVVLYMNNLYAVAVGRAGRLFAAQLVTAAIDVALCPALVQAAGAKGAALALLTGFFCGSMVMAWSNRFSGLGYRWRDLPLFLLPLGLLAEDWSPALFVLAAILLAGFGLPIARRFLPVPQVMPRNA